MSLVGGASTISPRARAVGDILPIVTSISREVSGRPADPNSNSWRLGADKWCSGILTVRLRAKAGWSRPPCWVWGGPWAKTGAKRHSRCHRAVGDLVASVDGGYVFASRRLPLQNSAEPPPTGLHFGGRRYQRRSWSRALAQSPMEGHESSTSTPDQPVKPGGACPPRVTVITVTKAAYVFLHPGRGRNDTAGLAVFGW